MAPTTEKIRACVEARGCDLRSQAAASRPPGGNIKHSKTNGQTKGLLAGRLHFRQTAARAGAEKMLSQ